MMKGRNVLFAGLRRPRKLDLTLTRNAVSHIQHASRLEAPVTRMDAFSLTRFAYERMKKIQNTSAKVKITSGKKKTKQVESQAKNSKTDLSGMSSSQLEALSRFLCSSAAFSAEDQIQTPSSSSSLSSSATTAAAATPATTRTATNEIQTIVSDSLTASSSNVSKIDLPQDFVNIAERFVKLVEDLPIQKNYSHIAEVVKHLARATKFASSQKQDWHKQEIFLLPLQQASEKLDTNNFPPDTLARCMLSFSDLTQILPKDASIACRDKFLQIITNEKFCGELKKTRSVSVVAAALAKWQQQKVGVLPREFLVHASSNLCERKPDPHTIELFCWACSLNPKYFEENFEDTTDTALNKNVGKLLHNFANMPQKIDAWCFINTAYSASRFMRKLPRAFVKRYVEGYGEWCFDKCSEGDKKRGDALLLQFQKIVTKYFVPSFVVLISFSFVSNFNLYLYF